MGSGFNNLAASKINGSTALAELPAERRVRHLEARIKEGALKISLREQTKLTASYAGGIPTRTSEGYPRSDAYRFQNAKERQELGNARDRAYQAVRNNPVARTLIDCETDNVMGDGLNYHPTTLDPDWNQEAQDRYYLWLDQCSVRGPDIHTGCELSRLIWNRSRVGGDLGWVLVSQYINGRPESKIQVVQAENIATPDGMWGDPQVYDGIRFDDYGRPIVFYVLNRDERTGKRVFSPVSAQDFVFLPHMTSSDQARGETCFMQAFDILSHLDRYVDGVALAAWMGTVFGIVFKQADAAKQINMLGSLTNSAGNLQKAVTLEGGMVKYVGKDDEVAQVQAHQPMQNTPDFIRAMLRLAGMVFGMPLEAFARDMSTCNFASARIGLLPFYRSCRIKAQGTFGPRWSRTIRWWLSRERLRASDDPKKWTTPFPPDYWNHELTTNAWEYTDPVSEAQGDMLQVDMGSKSMQMVISDRGRDAERITRERIEWKSKTAGLPMIHSTMTRDIDARLDEGDRQFHRDYVKGMMDDITHKNVLFNNTDVLGEMDKVGLIRREFPDGDAMPLLPIVAANGPLVSGAEVRGPDGKLVGGDVEAGISTIDTGGDNSAGAEGATDGASDPQQNQMAQAMIMMAAAIGKIGGTSGVTVNIPEQPAPIISVNVPPAAVTVNVPEAKTPVVNIPAAQVNVTIPEQPAPQVTVNVPAAAAPIIHLPEQKPSEVQVHLPAPVVNVNVPKAEAPTVNVNVPKQEAPTVTVNVPPASTPAVNVNVPQAAPVVNIRQAEPKKRRTRKTVEGRDDAGRIKSVIEEDL